MLLLIPFLGGCKKATPGQNLMAPNIGVLDMDKTLRAHPRFSEVQKLEQQIEKRKAELTRESVNVPFNTSADSNLSGIASQEAAGLQQTINLQTDAKMNERKKDLERVLEARITAERQQFTQKLGEYVRELDKEYQPRILSLQLKMQTVQMTPEEKDVLNGQLTAIQNQRAGIIAKQQEVMEQELRQKIVVEQNTAEELLRQYHEELVATAKGQLSDKLTEIQARRVAPSVNTSIANKGTEQDDLRVLEDQLEKVRELIIRELKDAAAKVAAGQNLEVVISRYQLNVQSIDITDAVIAVIKK